MTNSLSNYKIQLNDKKIDDKIGESSIFEFLENDFQIGDLVWAKLNDDSWWPSFIFGSYYDDWKYVKVVFESGLSNKRQYFVYNFGLRFSSSWISQTKLRRYKGSDELLTNSNNEIVSEKEIVIEINEKLQNMSDELRSLWKDALREADYNLSLSLDLRKNSLNKIVEQFVYNLDSQINEQSKMVKKLGNLTPLDSDEQGLKLQVKCQPSTCNTTNESLKTIKKSQKTSSTTSKRRKKLKTSEIQSEHISCPIFNEPDNDIVIVQLNTQLQTNSVSLTTAICHFLDKGIPSLTKYEEICLVNLLINHPMGNTLTLTDAQIYFEKYVLNIALNNYHYQMLFVQSEYFYEFLLKYPEIILKHRQWFKDYKPTRMPIGWNRIELKKWQLATLLYAHENLEKNTG